DQDNIEDVIFRYNNNIYYRLGKDVINKSKSIIVNEKNLNELINVVELFDLSFVGRNLGESEVTIVSDNEAISFKKKGEVNNKNLVKVQPVDGFIFQYSFNLNVDVTQLKKSNGRIFFIQNSDTLETISLFLNQFEPIAKRNVFYKQSEAIQVSLNNSYDSLLLHMDYMPNGFEKTTDSSFSFVPIKYNANSELTIISKRDNNLYKQAIRPILTYEAIHTGAEPIFVKQMNNVINPASVNNDFIFHVIDINHDGLFDLLYKVEGKYGTPSLHLGAKLQSDELFTLNSTQTQLNVSLPTTYSPFGFVDINNDSYPDLIRKYGQYLVLSMYNTSESINNVYLNSNNYFDSENSRISYISGDVNKDGFDDVISFGDLSIKYLVNLAGEGSSIYLKSIQIKTEVNQNFHDYSLHDINNDGFLDIVYAFENTLQAFIYLPTTKLFDLNSPVILAEFENTNKIVSYDLFDLNFDDSYELIVIFTNESGDNWSNIYKSTKDVLDTDNIIYSSYLNSNPLEKVKFDYADLNGDQKLDVVLMANQLFSFYSTSTSIMERYSNYDIQILDENFCKDFTIKDFNSDGKPDIYANTTLNNIHKFVLFENSTLTFTSNESQDIVKEFALKQNYPNPFNPTTTITYDLSAIGHTKLELFDILGRKVSTLVNKVEQIGTHTVHLDAAGLASGVYLLRLTQGEKVAFRKMTLLK
ncbi:T9SS type A sorting domain-containing protein, partial [bacterium]